MSNIDLVPWTREYYNARKLPKSPGKPELIQRLRIKMYSQVALQLVEENRPTMEELQDVKWLQYHDLWMAKYSERDQNNMIDRVLGSRLITRMDQLLWENEGDSVYNFLIELRGAIWNNQWLLDETDYDDTTKYMGKEWAQHFVDGWIDAFKGRWHLDGESSTDDDAIYQERNEWPMERKYELLGKMVELSDEQKAKLISSICKNLPAYDGDEFEWNTMQDLYDKTLVNKVL